MKQFIIKSRKKGLSILFWIFIWQILSMLVGNELYLPSPFGAINSLRDQLLMKDFLFLKTVGATMLRVLIGFLLACFAGIILGIASGLNSVVYELINPLIIAIKSIPVMSFILLAIIWIHSSGVPILVCFLMCFPLIWSSSLTGIREVDQDLIEMAKVHKAKNRYIIRYIYIPFMIPYVLNSMVTALGLGWKSTIAAEVLSPTKFAIGTKLFTSKIYLEIADLVAWTVVIVIFSILTESLFKYISNKVLRKYIVNR